jgi:hypothetical protein
MITTEQINAITAKLETMGLSDDTVYETHPCVSPYGPADGCSNSLQANLSALRQQFPDIHFTYCMDDDLPNNTPVIEHKDFNLYLIDGREHCLCLTNDYDIATGIVVAEIIPD